MRIANNGLGGPDAEATVTLTPDMVRRTPAAAESISKALDPTDVSNASVASVSASLDVVVEVEVEVNCPKCDGWGEKEGHWTMAIDKLCVKCKGFGRVEVKKKVKVPVREGVADGEVVTVLGAGNGGFSKPLNALGLMSDPGQSGSLTVTVAVLAEGKTRRG
jgi:molecular chaperone DnaJ